MSSSTPMRCTIRFKLPCSFPRACQFSLLAEPCCHYLNVLVSNQKHTRNQVQQVMRLLCIVSVLNSTSCCQNLCTQLLQTMAPALVDKVEGVEGTRKIVEMEAQDGERRNRRQALRLWCTDLGQSAYKAMEKQKKLEKRTFRNQVSCSQFCSLYFSLKSVWAVVSYFARVKLMCR